MSSEPSCLADLRYTCPVCTDSLSPPVFQCRNGHLMCEGCSSRLRNCGVCRATLPQHDWGRNLEVEKIIRMIQHPCPNETDGCQTKLKFDKLEAHTMECYYTKFPICELLFGYRDCEELRICNFEKHFEKEHGHKSINVSDTLPVSHERSIVDINKRGFWSRIKVKFEKKAILVMVDVDVDAANGLLKLKPWVMAEKAVANQLNCEITFSSGKDVKISIDAPIFNLETKKEELLACAGISLKYLQSIFPLAQACETGKNRFRTKLSIKTGTLRNEQASSAMDLSST